VTALARPGDLRVVLGIPFTDEQLAAATAPLEPGLVVAGAGSGKTSVMAARVVWLVGTGQVEPDRVLGLTFTNKAAAELAGRIRTALSAAGVAPTAGDQPYDDDGPGEPVVSTYHAFAGRLVTEHGCAWASSRGRGCSPMRRATSWPPGSCAATVVRSRT
jgi:DNA helicase-2/ATP-dependent DNA helicase PcrA